jgi:uncharacterized protein (TIGR03437 family)
LQIQITDATASLWGFELSARFTNGTQAGTLVPGANVSVRTSASGVQYAAQTNDTTSSFTVTWTAPPDSTGGEVVINMAVVASDRASRLERRVAAGPPQVTSAGVVGAADYQSPLSPGQLFSIFGKNLNTGDPSAAAGFPLSTQLGGARVTMNGAPCPILYSSSTQINAQVPFGLDPTSAAMLIAIGGSLASSPVNVALAATAPAIFTVTATGNGAGAILHADYVPVSASRPATAGETVLIFATGLGLVTPIVVDGAAAPNFSQTLAGVSATIGGQTAPVSYHGLAPGFAGLYQINAAIPPKTSGIVEIRVTAGAVTSGTGVTIQIQ